LTYTHTMTENRHIRTEIAMTDTLPETRQDRLHEWLQELGPTAAAVAGFAALLWTVIAAYFIAVADGTSIDTGMMWLIAAGFALGIAIAARPDRLRDAFQIEPLAAHGIWVRTRTRWLPTLAGALMLALLAEINGDIIEPEQLRDVSYHAQFVLLILGVGLLAWGLHGRRIIPARPARSVDWRTVAGHALPLLGILLVATVTRFYLLETGARLFIDEVHFANPVQHFNDATDIELLIPFSSVAAFPYLYPYWQWMGAETFGYTLLGLRAVSAIFGVLGVGAVYWLGCELFDRKTALIAALLLATFPPHLHFSRMGLNNIADPFFGTLTLVFIVRGLRSPDWRDLRGNFALAGVMLGLTQYFYEGGRLLYPPLVIAWLLGLVAIGYIVVSVRLVNEDDAESRAVLVGRVLRVDWRNLVMAGVVLMVGAVMVGGPIYYTLAGQEKSALRRLETAGVGGDERFIVIEDGDDLQQHIAKQFRRSVLLHTSQPEAALYYAGDKPMVHPLLLPVFLLGIVWCFVRVYSHGGASLLLGWLLLTMLGNTLMQDSRIAARYVVSFPAMTLLMALGLRAAGCIILPTRDRARYALLAVAALGLAVYQADYYFNTHLPLFNDQFRTRLVRDSHDVLFRAADMPTDTIVYMIGEQRMSGRDAAEYLRFLNRGMTITTLLPDEFTAETAAQLSRDTTMAFFIDPTDIDILLRLQAFFPDLDGPHYSDFDIPRNQQYALYVAPATGQ